MSRWILPIYADNTPPSLNSSPSESDEPSPPSLTAEDEEDSSTASISPHPHRRHSRTFSHHSEHQDHPSHFSPSGVMKILTRPLRSFETNTTGAYLAEVLVLSCILLLVMLSRDTGLLPESEGDCSSYDSTITRGQFHMATKKALFMGILEPTPSSSSSLPSSSSSSSSISNTMELISQTGRLFHDYSVLVYDSNPASSSSLSSSPFSNLHVLSESNNNNNNNNNNNHYSAAHAHNRLLSQIREHPDKYSMYDYFILVDFQNLSSWHVDGVVHTMGISADELLSTHNRNIVKKGRNVWDVMCANGVIDDGHYHDTLNFRTNEFMDTFHDPAQNDAAKRTYPKCTSLVRAHSCFGGLAIYKKHALLSYPQCSYSHTPNIEGDDNEIEHVIFNTCLYRNGVEIWMNPSMISHYSFSFFSFLHSFGSKYFFSLIFIIAVAILGSINWKYKGKFLFNSMMGHSPQPYMSFFSRMSTKLFLVRDRYKRALYILLPLISAFVFAFVWLTLVHRQDLYFVSNDGIAHPPHVYISNMFSSAHTPTTSLNGSDVYCCGNNRLIDHIYVSHNKKEPLRGEYMNHVLRDVLHINESDFEVRGEWGASRVRANLNEVYSSMFTTEVMNNHVPLADWDMNVAAEMDIYSYGHAKWEPFSNEIAGRIANFMQHFTFFKETVTRNYSNVLILEDDVAFSYDFNELFPELMQEVPSDFDVVFVGGCARKHAPTQFSKQVSEHVHLVRLHRCANGYVLSNKGAKKLIEAKTPPYMTNIDGWLEMMMGDVITKIYWLEPPLIFEGTKALNKPFVSHRKGG